MEEGRPTGSLVFVDLYPAANEAAVPGAAVKNANPIQRARMYVYTVPRPRAPRTLLEIGFLGSDGDEFNLDSGSSVAAMGLKNALHGQRARRDGASQGPLSSSS